MDVLKDFRISPGDLFFKKASGRVRLIKAGDPIDWSVISRYEKLSGGLELDERFSRETYEEGVAVWNTWKSSTDILAGRENSSEVINWFKDHFISQNEEGELLTVCQIGYEVFFSLPESIYQELIESDIDAFNRQGILASLGCYLALAMGYCDFNYIKELYHLFFFSFYGSQKRFLLKKYMNQNMTGKAFSDSCFEFDENQYASLKEYASVAIVNESLLMSLQWALSDPDGNSKVCSANERELSDIELLISFLMRLLPFKEDNFESRETIKSLLEDSSKIKSGRVSQLLSSLLDERGAA